MDQHLIQQLARNAWGEAYALSMHAPKKERIFLWGLISYLDALAQIDTIVSDPTLKLIRLRWWRDHVGQDVTGQPILQALATRPDLTVDLDKLTELHEHNTLNIDQQFWTIWLKIYEHDTVLPEGFISTVTKARYNWTGYGVDAPLSDFDMNDIPQPLKPMAKTLHRSWDGNPAWRTLRILLNI